MAFLLTFGKTKEEKRIFEAFWIGFMAFPPTFDDSIIAKKLRENISEKSIDGGSIKLSACPGCGQRVLQHDRLRTLKEDAGLDLIIEQEEFNYIRGQFKKFERVWDELLDPFVVIKERFEEMKPKDIPHWQKFIEDRDAVKAEASGATG